MYLINTNGVKSNIKNKSPAKTENFPKIIQLLLYNNNGYT